jgi:Uma2 family endonuclease
MATSGRALATADEFIRMGLGDGTLELVRGKVVEVPTPVPVHGVKCGNEALPRLLFVRQAEYGYVLTNDAALQTERGPNAARGPDISFYGRARRPRSEVGSTDPPVPPALAVEVVSPGNTISKVLYLAAGVPMV